MVSRCVAIEVQRNAKWGSFMWKRKMGEMGEECGLGRKRKYHPSLCARVIL